MEVVVLLSTTVPGFAHVVVSVMVERRMPEQFIAVPRVSVLALSVLVVAIDRVQPSAKTERRDRLISGQKAIESGRSTQVTQVSPRILGRLAMVVSALNIPPSLFSLGTGKPLGAGILLLLPMSLLPSLLPFSGRKGLSSRMCYPRPVSFNARSVDLGTPSIVLCVFTIPPILITVPVLVAISIFLMVLPMIVLVALAPMILSFCRYRKHGRSDQCDRKHQRCGQFLQFE